MTSSDEIADAVVEHLNSAEVQATMSIKFQAVNPPTVPILDRAVDSGTVQVYPFEESETPRDRGDMLEGLRTLGVIVQAPMGETLTRRQCLDWLNEIKESFRELRVSADDGDWRWDGSDNVSLYDFEAMKVKQQFLSLFRPKFKNFA